MMRYVIERGVFLESTLLDLETLEWGTYYILESFSHSCVQLSCFISHLIKLDLSQFSLFFTMRGTCCHLFHLLQKKGSVR